MKVPSRQTAPVEISACEGAPHAQALRRLPPTSNQDSFGSCFHPEVICYPHMPISKHRWRSFGCLLSIWIQQTWTRESSLLRGNAIYPTNRAKLPKTVSVSFLLRHDSRRLCRLLFFCLVINLSEVRVDDIFSVLVLGSARITRAVPRLSGNCFTELDCRLR
jgi:hypothetical protein